MKTKKLSPDFGEETQTATLIPVFQEFAPTSASETRQDRFSLASDFWRILETDPTLKDELDFRISKLAEKRIEEVKKQAESDAVKVHETAMKAGREEGIAQGIEEGKKEIGEVVRRVNTLAEKFIAEKSKLLSSHEKALCRTLGHLLDRFLVNDSERKVETFQKWLDVSVKGFSERGKVRIYLSVAEHDLLAPLLKNSLGQSWELVPDTKLKPGEIRWECDDGGFFFDPLAEKEKFGKLFEVVFGNDGVKDVAA